MSYMAYQMDGTVAAISRVEKLVSKTGNDYERQSIAIYPDQEVEFYEQDNTPEFVFVGKKVANYSITLRPGDKVTVYFAVVGRSWTSPQGVTKIYNELRPINIVLRERPTAAAPAVDAAEELSPAQEPQPTPAAPADGDKRDTNDELPF